MADGERPQVALPQARKAEEAKAPDAADMREQAILTGQPVRRVRLPDGTEVGLYPKPQAYFYRIEGAVNAYLEALATYDVRASRKARGFWPLSWWRDVRCRTALDRIERTKYRLLALILEDRYVPERHHELSAEQFLQMPHDVVVQILEGYREANDIEDILKRLIRDYGKKKEMLSALLTRSSTRQ